MSVMPRCRKTTPEDHDRDQGARRRSTGAEARSPGRRAAAPPDLPADQEEAGESWRRTPRRRLGVQRRSRAASSSEAPSAARRAAPAASYRLGSRLISLSCRLDRRRVEPVVLIDEIVREELVVGHDRLARAVVDEIILQDGEPGRVVPSPALVRPSSTRMSRSPTSRMCCCSLTVLSLTSGGRFCGSAFQ